MTEKLHLPVVAGSPAQDKPKVGVYVCHCGGNISDVGDVKAGAEAAGPQGRTTVGRQSGPSAVARRVPCVLPGTNGNAANTA